MRRPSQVFAAVFAAGVAIAAVVVVGWSSPSVAAEVCGPVNPPSQPGQSADAKVILKNTQYQPAAVSLPQTGMSVCWEHQDGTTGHSITFDAPASPFDYPGSQCTPGGNPDNCYQQDDQPPKVIFDSAGTFNYHCKIHPGMTGVITVAGGGPVATTTTRPGGTTTTRANTGTTATSVGTLTPETTSTTLEVTTTSEATTSTSIDLTTSTTSDESASADEGDDGGVSSRGVLQVVGTLLLAAVIAALIPSWRRLT